MKLWKRSARGFQYELDEKEAQSLRVLVAHFPIRQFAQVKISKSDDGAAEREKLLNDSLAAHRNELKQQAEGLVSEDKFKGTGERRFFRIKAEEREMMLQILNDIRMESWRILGEPEDLEMDVLRLPKEKIQYYRFMHLAGYFEYHFLNPENAGPS